MGCRWPRRGPGAGSVRSTHSASSRARNAASSNSCLRASSAASNCCLAALSTWPMRLRSSGESLPMPLLISASAPLRPTRPRGPLRDPRRSQRQRCAQGNATPVPVWIRQACDGNFIVATAARPTPKCPNLGQISAPTVASAVFRRTRVLFPREREIMGPWHTNSLPSTWRSPSLVFRYYKKMAEDAMAQVTDGGIASSRSTLKSNSIALIVKHMAGNMRSRWTEFLTTDGEKPDRQRDSRVRRNRTSLAPELMRAVGRRLGLRLAGTRTVHRSRSATRRVTIRDRDRIR